MSSKFGKTFNEVWPRTSTPGYTKFGFKLLNDCRKLTKPGNVKLEDILENSTNFPIEFPIDTCRVLSQPLDRMSIIEEQINSAYPVLHERAVWLCTRFLEHKLEYGNPIEKSVYKDMSLTQFVDRLLTKRCCTFLAQTERYLLLNGERGLTGYESVGSEDESPPLILKDCLSYEEIKLSAFLSVSSHSEFINNGRRSNAGVPEENLDAIEKSGVIIGYIGAILFRHGIMEFEDIIISKNQNTNENGYNIKKNLPSKNAKLAQKQDYRKMWNEFYDENSKLYIKTRVDKKRFCYYKKSLQIFDNDVMKKRFTISFDTLLLEANARAAASGKQGYLHVVGIGLGSWLVASHQEEVFLEAFFQRIKILLPKLKHISFINFGWFRLEKIKEIMHGKVLQSSRHPKGGIKVLFSKRSPADRLEGEEYKNTLLIVSYAWDGNAHPGNEFWQGSLTSSGDPAAACSTLITELHNAHINKKKVCGDNLHVASAELGVVHLSEYAKYLMEHPQISESKSELTNKDYQSGKVCSYL